MRRLLARSGPALRLAALTGFVGGTIRATIQVHDFAAVATKTFAVERFVAGAARFAIAALVFAAAVMLIDAALRRIAPKLRPRRRSALALALGMAAPALVLTDWVNERFLPDLLDPISIAGNATLGIAVVAVFVWALPRATRALGDAPTPPGAVSVLLVAGILLANGLRLALPAATEPPPVVLIVIDALRADALGSYGYARPTSPALDRFARDAVRFDTAISQSTFTKTSIASLLTGLFPHRHGVYLGNAVQADGSVRADALADRHTTLAESLQDRGLLTAAWVRNPHLRHDMGFEQGFLLYRDQHRPSLGGWQLRRLREAIRGRPLDNLPNDATSLAGRLTRFIADTAGRQPFFAYLHLLDLHAPYVPRPEFAALFDAEEAPEGTADSPGWNTYKRSIREGERVPSAEELALLRARYDALIRQIDTALGRLFDDLRRLGVYDRGLIVVTSDHGDAFAEHGFVSHSDFPYDELIRVPLLIKFPDNRYAGRVVDHQVRLVDVAPTLVAAVGAAPLPDIDGVSLTRLLDEAEPDTTPFELALTEFVDILSLRTPAWKLIEIAYAKPRLYDLRTDPAEQHDLAASRPEIVSTLHRLIPERPLVGQRAVAPPVELDPETVEELRALGYID